MPASNTNQSFGTVTRIFHWLTALLVISMIPLGIIASGMADQIADGATDPALIQRTQRLFTLHKTTGVLIFFVALARILWAISQPKPAPLHPDRRAETFLAALVHWRLYASLLLVPLSGWVHHAATTGFAPIWWPFGQSLPFVPKSPELAQTASALHGIFERVLVVSILLHVAGALKHHIVDRDDTLRRMWNGTAAAGPKPHSTPLAAPLTAVGVFALALTIGSSLGLFQHSDPQADTLDTVASDWTVTEGTIAITVTQLGSAVDGSFADWTSSISFDPTITEGTAGSVTTTIAIASLTLGSVTSQAMGPDFFDATNFPTATYTGDLIAGPDGFYSDGILSIRDASVPVSFPFDLDMADDLAKMTGSVSVNRFDFGIGAGTDESNLGPEVIITLSLSATQAQ